MNIHSENPEVAESLEKARRSPLYFAENFLLEPETLKPFKANYPQRFIFTSKKKATWILVHRRSGKSYSMAVIALWHAIFRENKRITIFAPSKTQINEFFTNIDNFIRANPILQECKTRVGNQKDPQKRSFITGSVIYGHVLGVSSGSEEGKRGITSDVVIVDEAQILSMEDWRVVEALMRGDQTRLGKVYSYIAGTIKEPIGRFYEKVSKEGSDDFSNVIFIPIDKNKSYCEEEIEMIRAQTPNSIWNTEWMLQVGDLETSVFKKEDIDEACAYDWDYSPANILEGKLIIVGVDWDKVQSGTNIAVIQYDTITGEMSTIYREEVPQTEFTYLDACSKIIDIYYAFNPDVIVADQGQGEVQWEYLYQESLKRGLDLHERLVKLAFNERIEVLDIQTGEPKNKIIKPILVGMLQKKFQEHKYHFPASDKDLKDQYLSYKVIKRTDNTTKYSSTNEHIIDCHLFALYGIYLIGEDVFQQRTDGMNEMRTLTRDDLNQGSEYAEESFWGNILNGRADYCGMEMFRTEIPGDWRRSGF